MRQHEERKSEASHGRTQSEDGSEPSKRLKLDEPPSRELPTLENANYFNFMGASDKVIYAHFDHLIDDLKERRNWQHLAM